MVLAGIEAGGTKFVVCIGDEKGNIKERISIPTTTPKETVQKVAEFLKYQNEKSNIEAIGIGCFGPIDLNPKSATYGYITTTPKTGWQDFDIVGELKKYFPGLPIGFDTDVNAAVLGESQYGAAKGLTDAIYLTIGTGIGGGIITNGQLVHGLMHPEMGHILLAKHEKDSYGGKCPYHKNCFEGLAAGPAIEERWGTKGDELDESHQAWDMEAWYIAQAVANYSMILSPQRIILGGGVMHQRQLLPMIRQYVLENLNGYLSKSEVSAEKIADYIVAPGLGDNAGACGCLALARMAKCTDGQ